MSIFMTQTACAYAAAPPSPKQHSRTSSAFSISAKPDEDWTKISDLVERRRIQNRIAQRNYRKKLKQRLEDLERRAGFSGDSESKEKSYRITKSKQSSSKPRKPEPCAATKPVVSQDQFIYSMVSTDRPSPGIYSPRARPDTFTEFSSSTYSASDKIFLAPNDPAQAYPTMAIGDAYHNYTLASIVPMMFPSIIHASASIEREPYQAGDKLAISATYHYTPPMSFNAPCPYNQPNFHTPDSSDRPSNCSEAGYEYPTIANWPGPIHPQRETKDYICNFHLNPAKTTTMTKTWLPTES
ncbi:hypothetical protein BHE90_017241 [Fusarium euwallaceae]|uniref:BZIP domain-containing protein n=1 Tax=Fusarium euwallaceae TaxID=1147111 RepID=A0A430KY10_9HYPO|nr:hypothetical protein BHE90_017241 [Fusarium euwallaceae]